MRLLIVAFFTIVVLSLQYHFGLWKNKLLGLIIPGLMAAVFVYLSVTEETTGYIVQGIICVVAVAVVWLLGYRKAVRFERSELERMKKRDLE